MASIALSPAQLDELIVSIRDQVVAELLTSYREELDLLTPSQLAGILNVNIKTLDALPDGPPRITLQVNKTIRYSRSAVVAWLARRTG